MICGKHSVTVTTFERVPEEEREQIHLTPMWLIYGLSGKTTGECKSIEDHWRETGEVPDEVAARNSKDGNSN